MKQRTLSTLALALVMSVSTITAIAQATFGGAPMYTGKDIMDAAALMQAINAGGGTAKVTIADVIQSNGVIHVVDKVLLPK